ncbi:MAG: HAD hydrolase-like protein [Lachnospiraceae bacterium]|nr:HAD hydrolase-like protein [Lachnospiraceae bacterium]
MSKYKYVFFDLDGTLTQSEFGIIESARKALEKMGVIDEDYENLKKFIGPPLYVSFHERYGMNEEQCLEAIRLYREHYEKEGIFKAPLYDGVKEMLEDLKNGGCTLMMVTSKPKVLAEVVAENNGIRDSFEAIVGPSKEDRNPSKTRLIREAMDSLNLTDDDRAEIVMVGDRFYDIEAAVEVGVDSIGVLYGYGSEEELRKAGATYIVVTAEDVQKKVLK